MSSPAEEETELQARSEIDRFTTRIIDLKQQFLGAATEGEDFFRSREEGIGNHEFRTQEGADFEAMVFGELLPATYGTKISATGNYTPMRGRNFKPIQDGSSVKDIHALTNVTSSNTVLNALFNNMIATLNEIHERDDEADAKLKKFPSANYDWVKTSGRAGCDIDMILVTMNNKYVSPAKQQKFGPIISGPRVTKKIDVHKLRTGETSEPVVPKAGNKRREPEPSEPPATYVGALYNPQLQPDFGGLYFDLHDDRLLQLDIRDVKGDLITPQQMYDKLRPGTLLLYCINLHVYNIQNRGQDDPGFRRFYQIRAKSARIIRESTLKPEIRQMPQVPSEYKMLKSQSQNSDLQPMSSSAAMKAFNDFSLSNDEDDHKRKEDLPLTSSRKYEKSKVKASDRKEKGKEREMQID